MKAFLLVAMSVMLLSSASPARADEMRTARPNAVSFEFFGRNITYNLAYDRALGPDWAVGVGLGRVGLRDLSGTEVGESAMLLPLYAHYYLFRDASSPYITVGATFMISGAAPLRRTNSPTLEFPENSLLTSVGVGYESRSHIGFLFRVAAYIIGGKTVLPWVGASAGWSF